MRSIRLAVLIGSTLVAALLLVPSALAAAQVSFSGPTNFPVGSFPASVAVGDFDGDNDPDLAVANEFSNSVSVLRGGAGGGFTAAASVPVGSFPVSVAVGDFNGDNDPDLATANGSSNNVSVLLGGAAAGFAAQTAYPAGGFPAGSFPYSVAVGDFNGDADPDLAVADQSFGKVFVLVGSTGGTFTGPTTLTTGLSAATSVAVGEFNQDGDPDLAVADQLSGKVVVLLGTTGTSFTTTTVVPNAGDLVSVAVGEFNQDGDPDLAIAEQSSGQVLVLLGSAGGSFTGPTAVPPENQAVGSLSSVAVGDFNGDGDPDLAAANIDLNKVSVLLGGAAGSFGSPIDFTVGNGPASVAVADFNGDGKPDLADANVRSSSVSVLLNTTVTNRAPTADADAYSTAEDTPLTVGAPGVLANDSDPDGNPLSTVAGSGPSHGTLALNANGSFIYTPAANYSGSDSFTYRASDGTLESGLATVSITVTAVNDAPTAVNDAYSTAEDTALTVAAASGMLANDSDIDSTALSAVLVSEPSQGSLTLNADGSLAYTPAANYTGSDSFTYRASDGTATSGLATVTITITAVNDSPSAVDDTYSTAEDTALTVAAPGVLGNDSDPDGVSLSAVVDSGPTHGSLTLNPDGSFTYTPAANYTGSDSFTYRASDGTLTSGLAAGTITVTATNDAPTVTVAAGGTCGRDDHSGTINLTVADVESPAGLTLSATSSNPLLVPTGNVAFAGSGAARTMTVSAVDGRSGTATLTVTVSDGQDSGLVEVTVKVGGGGKDTLIGTAGADLLLAQSNNDTLTGEGGNDLLCGDSGGDTLSGGGGDDSLGGGSGTDRLTGGSGADRFSGGSGTDTTTDFAAAEGDTSDGTIP
jgi:VCBS repeat-containing protein